MRLLGTILSLLACLAVVPGPVFARDEFKVTMEDVLKEISNMRRELRELKIQRERDQRTIEDLRRIVENGIPPVTEDMPQPAVARTPGDTSKPRIEPVNTPAPRPEVRLIQNERRR